MAALAFQESLFATKHAVQRWRERIEDDGSAVSQTFFRCARRARPATLAEIRAYRKPHFTDTRLAVDDEMGVVFYLKKMPGPPEGWVVVTVLKLTGGES